MKFRPIPEITERLKARFYKDVKIQGPCWNWVGSMIPNGYGIMNFARNQHFGAHRVSYAIHIGEIPEGLDIDHLCRNRRCVNPLHLEAVTRAVNIRRGVSPAAQRAKQTHCKRGHEFSESNTWRNCHGWRYCKECDRLRHAGQI